LERPTFNRTNFVILLVIILGLVSLGMKLPNLQELASSSGKPKPRPRAVVKTQIKSCQESIKKLSIDASPDGPVRNSLAKFFLFVAPRGLLLSVNPPVDFIVSNTLSRAPPSHS
jgi:hypothetical protein